MSLTILKENQTKIQNLMQVLSLKIQSKYFKKSIRSQSRQSLLL